MTSHSQHRRLGRASRRVVAAFGAVALLIAAAITPAGATGDLNNDGFDDLVIGATDEGVRGSEGAGGINILDGRRTGITLKNDQSFTQASLDGSAEANDHFGRSVAYGDFDRDGFDDVAVGAPGEDHFGRRDAGVVHVFYGHRAGAGARRDTLLSQRSPVKGANETGDVFGSTLAAGDFDNDGYDDLAIGAPGENLKGAIGAGAVTIVYGGPSGVTGNRSKVISQAGKVPGKPELFDGFASSLTVGNFNGDKFDDLAVGVPGEDNGAGVDGGSVNILFGSRTGLRKGGQAISAANLGVAGAADDRLGFSLAAGDFNRDGRDDLFMGVPHRDGDGVADSGGVAVGFGGPSGISLGNGQLLAQGSVSGDGSQIGDQWGWSLAAADFDGDGFTDLVVGAPHDDIAGRTDSGAITVLMGVNTGPLGAPSVSWSQIDLPGSGNETGDQFGRELRAGNFNGDRFDDLAIGVPFEDIGARIDAGGVSVVYSNAGGLSAPSAKFFHQSRKAIIGKAEPGDLFGGGL